MTLRDGHYWCRDRPRDPNSQPLMRAKVRGSMGWPLTRMSPVMRPAVLRFAITSISVVFRAGRGGGQLATAVGCRHRCRRALPGAAHASLVAACVPQLTQLHMLHSPHRNGVCPRCPAHLHQRRP